MDGRDVGGDGDWWGEADEDDGSCEDDGDKDHVNEYIDGVAVWQQSQLRDGRVCTVFGVEGELGGCLQ